MVEMGNGKRGSSDFPFSFGQVITVLGILGVSIGVISLFFYAIAEGWVSKSAQVGIGVFVGLILFFVAFLLRKKNPIWSYIVFGGAYFLEYLSIGVGVQVYKVMPATIGIIFSALILFSSVFLAAKFSSRVIAYFSLIGGFLVPIITDSFGNQVFVMLWYFLILASLSIIAISFKWEDLRVALFLFMLMFVVNSFPAVRDMASASSNGIEILFLISYFVLFNVSSLVNSILHDKTLSALDSVTLVVLPLLFLPKLYMMTTFSANFFGLFVCVFSLIYLLEAIYVRVKGLKFQGVKYALTAAGFTTLNLGIYFLFDGIFGLEYFLAFFVAEWALFSYFSSLDKTSDFYKIVKTLFLILIVIWYVFILRFNEGFYHASFFMVILLAIPIVALFYFRKGIDYKLNAAVFVISGYLFLFSFYKYLWWAWESVPGREVILSVLWLAYTLYLFLQVQTKEGKVLVGLLLGLTLLKIAFKDLLFLEGIYRIIGFTLFGVMLLVGGYFLENATK